MSPLTVYAPIDVNEAVRRRPEELAALKRGSSDSPASDRGSHPIRRWIERLRRSPAPL